MSNSLLFDRLSRLFVEAGVDDRVADGAEPAPAAPPLVLQFGFLHPRQLLHRLSGSLIQEHNESSSKRSLSSNENRSPSASHSNMNSMFCTPGRLLSTWWMPTLYLAHYSKIIETFIKKITKRPFTFAVYMYHRRTNSTKIAQWSAQVYLSSASKRDRPFSLRIQWRVGWRFGPLATLVVSWLVINRQSGLSQLTTHIRGPWHGLENVENHLSKSRRLPRM